MTRTHSPESIPCSSRTATGTTRQPRRRARSGWVHLCNGLDPVRDGGMVPSILGMTGSPQPPAR